MAPLPDAITLQEIQILRELPATSTSEPHPATDARSEQERFKKLAPAERDLAALSERLDRLHTVVILTGTATEIAALHRYMGNLDATDIFDKAELDCFNRIDNDKSGAVLQFRGVLAVQPGYGQPGGPTGPSPKSLASSRAEGGER